MQHESRKGHYVGSGDWKNDQMLIKGYALCSDGMISASDYSAHIAEAGTTGMIVL